MIAEASLASFQTLAMDERQVCCPAAGSLLLFDKAGLLGEGVLTHLLPPGDAGALRAAAARGSGRSDQ